MEKHYLEANLAQVAQCPHKRRHGGVVCTFVVMSSDVARLTVPSIDRALLK
jgi:hypothetical protein